MNHILWVYDRIDNQDEFGAVDDIETELVKGEWDNKTNSFNYTKEAKKSVVKAKVEYATSSSDIGAEKKLQPNTITATVYKCAPIRKEDIIYDPDFNELYTIASMIPVGKLFMELYLEKWD